MNTDFFRTGPRRPNTLVRRKILVDEHADLVRVVARQVGRKSNLGRCSMDEDDLFSVGILGLFDAETRFDPDNGTEFGKFAEWRIKGAMLDEMRRKDHMPRRLRTKARKLRAVEKRLANELGEYPTAEQVAEALDITPTKLARLRRRLEAFKFVSTDSGVPISDHAPRPDRVAEKRQRHAQLAEALEQLSEREQIVLDLYFQQDYTLKEIAQVYDLTEGRISQIKSAATTRLRELMSQ